MFLAAKTTVRTALVSAMSASLLFLAASSDLPTCPTEDSPSCVWKGKVNGPTTGQPDPAWVAQWEAGR